MGATPAQAEEHRESLLYSLQRNHFSLSSPIWANFGKARGLPISCFGSHVEDTLDSILQTAHEVGMMSKFGGGTAAFFGDVRGRGAPITDNGFSEGAVHFMRLYDTVQQVSRQGQTRRGATAVYLPVDHPDIMEFLDIRDDGNPIQQLSPAVTVPEGWMQSMLNGDKDKRRVWARVLERRSESGMPYIFFDDNANDSTSPYHGSEYRVRHSQLCVSPDTQILTDRGYYPIGELEDEAVNVWNGREFSNVTVRKTGENQKLVRVTTDSGYTLDSTPYHKFYVHVNKWTTIEKRASELEPGDKLIKFDSLPVVEGTEELAFAYDNGFYSGDGCLTPQGQRIYLYGDKRELEPHLPSVSKWYVQEGRTYGHTKSLKDKFFVPTSDYTVESRLLWLAGFLDADGTVTNNNGSQAFQVASVEKEFLKEVQLMLQTLGVDSKVTFARAAGIYALPANDGTGESKEYQCREIHRLLINGNSMYKLTQLGLTCHRLKWEVRKPRQESSRFVRVVSVEELPDLSDTYCFTEPKRGLGTFNGLLTGQCSEIMLPTSEEESFVCCLASMNLATYDSWTGTESVGTLVRFLDTVIEEFLRKIEDDPERYRGLERARAFAENHRAIGIGQFGYHTYLQERGIPFGSLAATGFSRRVTKEIQDLSYEASEALGEALGIPPVAEALGLTRRNVTTTAIAPTTSSAFIHGQVSQSIEPIRSNYYIRGLAKSTTVYKNPVLKRLLAEKYNADNDTVWDTILSHDGSVRHLDFMDEHDREVFKTFAEISQLDVIVQAAVRQEFIDQGQSLNLMIHPDTPARDIHELHVEAWQRGIKSLYYQHSYSAAQEYNRDLMNCTVCEG